MEIDSNNTSTCDFWLYACTHCLLLAVQGEDGPAGPKGEHGLQGNKVRQ